jgi:hypothetical protein
MANRKRLFSKLETQTHLCPSPALQNARNAAAAVFPVRRNEVAQHRYDALFDNGGNSELAEHGLERLQQKQLP